jgi:hypothetical protein
MPQPPQLLGSFFSSTQLLLQSCRPLGQPQLPLMHASVAGQVTPQRPQLLASLPTKTQVPEQNCKPTGQVRPAELGQPLLPRAKTASSTATRALWPLAIIK